MPSITERPIDVGSRAVASTLAQKLVDATTGNKDGIVGNEDQPAGGALHTTWFDTNPLLFKLKETIDAGLSKSDEQQRLGIFLAGFEKTVGAPSTLARPDHVSAPDWNAYLVDKAITLTRLGRAPDSVVDQYVKASGTIDGEKLADRDVFTQTWAPTKAGEGSGKTLVFSPGFLETGRDYVDQIEQANALGYTCVVMDHQWAGLSSGDKGGIDSAAGITRDLASVVADAAQSGHHVVVVGTSMGGGA
ncbi:MAG TPA: alpha/beta hydrolase, partial [Myxococcota bacterium]